jgi:endonuclease/exonuclease/phosphatase family metal-dependent hydrolase
MALPIAPHRSSHPHAGRTAAGAATPTKPPDLLETPWATDGFTNAPDKHHHHGHANAGGKTGGTDFNLASFNVLGASHTKAGGEHPGEPGAIARMKAAVKEMKKNKLDVVGFQEMQAPQLKEFQKLTDNQYGVYPGFKLGNKNTENSIAWNKDKYALVEAHTIDIPYFNGHMRKMPVVTLRDKETGQEMVMMNVHNPADTRRFHNQEQYRDKATQIETDEIKKMEKKTGLPVFLTGDFNETTEADQHVTAATNLTPANLSAHNGDQNHVGIDHMYGSPRATFSHFKRDHGKLVQFASDHPMLVSHVHIKG